MVPKIGSKTTLKAYVSVQAKKKGAKRALAPLKLTSHKTKQDFDDDFSLFFWVVIYGIGREVR